MKSLVNDVWQHLNPDTLDALELMTSNNQEAITICLNAIMNVRSVDSECLDRHLGCLVPLFDLDQAGIHDTDIVILYRDVCHEHIGCFIALLRLVSIGLVPKETLRRVVKQHGDGFDVDETLSQYCVYTPSIHPENVIVCV